MDSWYTLQVFIFFIFVLLSGLFSTIESALHSLSKVSLKKLLEREGLHVHLLQTWSRDRTTLLNVVYFGNTLVRVAAAVLATRITIALARESEFREAYALALAVAAITLILLLLAEVVPKTIGRHSPERTFLILAPPADLALRIIRPFSAGFNWISRLVVALLGGVSSGSQSVTEAEIKELVDAGEKDGAIEESEKQMIHSIIEMGDTRVKEVMVPRVDMVCLDIETPMEEVLETMSREKLSRMPVYENSLDTIVGILHIKNILNSWRRGVKDMRAIEFITMPHFVPETAKVSDLIKEFQMRHLQMAIVVDEYGGTAGLVTMEDLVEEIVGEIKDEYDEATPLIKKQEDGSYVLDSKVSIDEFNQTFGTSLPTEEYQTVGGFVLWYLKRMPKKNEVIDYDKLRFTVFEADRKRIYKLVVQPTR